MRKSVKFAGIGVGAVVAIIIITSSGSKAPAPAATTVSAPTATATTALPAPAAQAPASPVPPAQDSGPARQFGAGTYEVGTDVKAGKYKTAGPGSDDIMKSCAWSRKKDASGDLGSLIAFNIVQGPGVVTINKGEVLDATGSCTWTFAG